MSFSLVGKTPPHGVSELKKPCASSAERRESCSSITLSLAERYGFTPKVCRPYRAQTKDKVEGFNHYLKNSFVVPLAASLNQVKLVLDMEVANSRDRPLADWMSPTPEYM